MGSAPSVGHENSTRAPIPSRLCLVCGASCNVNREDRADQEPRIEFEPEEEIGRWLNRANAARFEDSAAHPLLHTVDLQHDYVLSPGSAANRPQPSTHF